MLQGSDAVTNFVNDAVAAGRQNRQQSQSYAAAAMKDAITRVTQRPLLLRHSSPFRFFDRADSILTERSPAAVGDHASRE